MNAKSFLLALTLAASLSLCGCGGCANNGGNGAKADDATPADAKPQAVSESPKHKARKALADEDLSPEATATYAYLLYMQARMDDDEDMLLATADVWQKNGVPAQMWMEAGIWLYGRKSPHAVPFLQRACSLWPDDESLALLCAEAMGDAEMAQDGIAMMQDYLKRHPDSLDGRIELALLLIKTSQFDAAEKLFQSVDKDKRTGLVNYYHARALIAMHRQEEAIPLLQQTLQDMPDFAEALTELAFLREQRGEYREARPLYERLLKLNFAPQDIRLRLINVSLQLNQPQKAVTYVTQGPDETPFKLAAASLFVQARHFLQAEGILRRIVDAGGAPAEVYMLLADLSYQHRHDLPMALSWLDKVSDQGAEGWRIQLLRSQLLAESGQKEEALDTVRKAQKTWPDVVEFMEFEIRMLASDQKMTDALAVARKATARWPENGSLAFLLGSLLDENGKKDEAFSVMDNILKTQPDNHQALNYVGYTLAERNEDIGRAVQLLVRANELAPNQSYIVDSLAWALFRAGRVDEAWTEIRRAVQLDEKADPTIWEHYGDIAAKLGLMDEARKGWNEALQRQPANAEALQQKLKQQ